MNNTSFQCENVQNIINEFQMVIDALLLCFVADVDDNDGTDGKPYFASERLRVSTSTRYK